MLDEQFEFAISQYLDGALPADERNALETRLATDGEARTVLAEYRRLDAKLRSTPAAIPELRWDALAEHISAAIDHDERDRLLLPIGNTVSRSRFRLMPLAAAAAFVLASGIAVLVFQQSNPTQTVIPAPNPDSQVAFAEGPKPEVASGPSETVVSSIGPATPADGEVRLAESIVSRPSRVVWIASGADAVQDREPALY